MTQEHQNFINLVKDGAIAFMKSTGILASLTIAQAILESGWGAHAVGNNIFGVKATPGWTGATKDCTTKEFVNGQYVTVTAKFRDYPSIADSIADHASVLNLPRYANLKGVRDAETACNLVQQDGYATSPTYASTLFALIRDYGLTQYDAIEVSVPAPAPAPAPATETPQFIYEGAVVQIKASAGNYGGADPDVRIPDHYKGKPCTVIKVNSTRKEALIKEVGSWVKYSDLEAPSVAPAPASVPQPTPVCAPAPAERTYTVKPGDSFWKIAAEQMGSGAKYKELAENNGLQPTSTIYPGQVLKIPK